jgi:hypothetical protein
MAEEKTFYVGVGNRSGVRKDLLECSKNVVGLLKSYDKINSTREQKIEKIIELKNVLAEIKQINTVLRDKFPSEKISLKREKTTRIVERKAPVEKKAIVKTAYKKPNNEIKKLEEELSEIEERLSKMGA